MHVKKKKKREEKNRKSTKEVPFGGMIVEKATNAAIVSRHTFATRGAGLSGKEMKKK